ncbi:MAG: S-formylglutathione hydrolase [Arenicella sp.]|jgi:S-formylglutathione hydrolase
MQHLSSTKIFGGQQSQYKHQSASLNCEMVFSVYMPPQASNSKVPVLYWLSGLTCTDQNFVTKAGAQRYAAKHGIAIVCPDTSPRGDDVADDADGAWDFGLGAGFYVNATQAPWSDHYRMYDYVVDELPELINAHFEIDAQRAAICGHSMGGHGALTIALNNTDKYKSVSAFSPIVSPLNCPWGEKALGNYLGADKSTWGRYDTCSLIMSAGPQLPILVDQGTDDSFLKEQLKTELLEQASKNAAYPMSVRYQPGYDHSYYFISSFIGEHVAFHAKHLS